jgi:ferredoxin
MARRIVFSCDQGHYGHSMCSECHGNVENDYTTCHTCHVIFDEETKYE